MGVDPIRDVIYAHLVFRSGHLVYNMPRFVSYYQYFPSTQILPLINSIVSGLGVTISHYLTLSFLLSLGILPLVLIMRNTENVDGGLTLLVALLYATIPTILTWNYWVIPMAFAMLLMVYSLLLFSLSLSRRGMSVYLVLSFVFSVLTVMTHAGVGILLIGFYIVCQVVFSLRRRECRAFSRYLLVYNVALLVFTFTYWWFTGFLEQYLFRYLNRLYVNFMVALRDLLGLKMEPSTPSLITVPHIKPSTITKPEVIPKVLRCFPAMYPEYYLYPRWVWSSLWTLMPLLLFLIYMLKRIKISKLTFSVGFYSVILALFTPLALFLHLIWKADRYVASPTTIFIIIFIGAMTGLVLKSNAKIRLKAAISILIILLTVSSIFDPRVAYYVNPIEGDRVTFRLDERIAANYLVSKLDSGSVVSDYNLMTSYLYYLTIVKNKTYLKVFITPVHNILRDKVLYKGGWIFLLRVYSIESYYIWNWNYKRKPQVINKAFYYGNLVYANKDVFILKSVS